MESAGVPFSCAAEASLGGGRMDIAGLPTCARDLRAVLGRWGSTVCDNSPARRACSTAWRTYARHSSNNLCRWHTPLAHKTMLTLRYLELQRHMCGITDSDAYHTHIASMCTALPHILATQTLIVRITVSTVSDVSIDT